MLALVVRNFTPLPLQSYEHRATDSRLVRSTDVDLMGFLLALPITVLVSGAATLRYKNRDLPAHLERTTRSITLAAGVFWQSLFFTAGELKGQIE